MKVMFFVSCITDIAIFGNENKVEKYLKYVTLLTI